jgi:hypothetical protein
MPGRAPGKVVVERSCGASIPRVLPTSPATAVSIDPRREALKSGSRVSNHTFGISARSVLSVTSASVSGSPVGDTSCCPRCACGASSHHLTFGMTVVPCCTAMTVWGADQMTIGRTWYDWSETLSQPASLMRGASTDLIHDFASLFSDTRCSGRPRTGGAGIPGFRGHVGSDLCGILQTDYREYTFHALR